ncbi:hypothetical protein OIV83_000306 [Microbotryomycetes sp. JL201]|nr:hypothetical protein OIV83_000306 [Microbotryomycetes sp. JL201]
MSFAGLEHSILDSFRLLKITSLPDEQTYPPQSRHEEIHELLYDTPHFGLLLEPFIWHASPINSRTTDVGTKAPVGIILGTDPAFGHKEYSVVVPLHDKAIIWRQISHAKLFDFKFLQNGDRDSKHIKAQVVALWHVSNLPNNLTRSQDAQMYVLFVARITDANEMRRTRLANSTSAGVITAQYEHTLNNAHILRGVPSDHVDLVNDFLRAADFNKVVQSEPIEIIRLRSNVKGAKQWYLLARGGIRVMQWDAINGVPVLRWSMPFCDRIEWIDEITRRQCYRSIKALN